MTPLLFHLGHIPFSLTPLIFFSAVTIIDLLNLTKLTHGSEPIRLYILKPDKNQQKKNLKQNLIPAIYTLQSQYSITHGFLFLTTYPISFPFMFIMKICVIMLLNHFHLGYILKIRFLCLKRVNLETY